jgi:hypothetical protein
MTYLKFVVYTELGDGHSEDDVQNACDDAVTAIEHSGLGFTVEFAGISEHEGDMPKEQMGT